MAQNMISKMRKTPCNAPYKRSKTSGHTFGGEAQMQQFLEMRTAPYYSLVKLRMLQNQPEQALALLEHAKARVLLDVMQSGKTLVTKSMTPEERQKEKKLSIGSLT